MTSLDDHLRELFRSEGPDKADLAVDVGQVRAQVRRRTQRRWAAFGAVAAAAVAAGAVLAGALLAGPDGDDLHTTDTRTTEPEPSTSPTTDRTATTPTTETTVASTPTTSTSSTTTSTSAPPPEPSIRDVDLGAATYAAACAGFGDSRSARLSGGAAQLPIGSGSHYEVDLGSVGYADADGDGDEDAILLLRCTFAGASTDNSAQLRAYRATGDGSIEQVGASQVVEHVFSATGEGSRLALVVENYDADDPACCPSSAAREVWRFDGSRFVLDRTTPTSTPNTPG